MTTADDQLDPEGWRELVRQARQMQTAYAVINAIHGELSLDAITQGIVTSLVDIGELRGAEISIDARFDAMHAVATGRAGELAAPEHRSQTFAVFARGVEVGSLVTYYGADQNEAELSALLDFVLPTIWMAVDNALSFVEAMEYRATLERRVEERTAQLAEAHAQLAETVVDLREAKTSRDRFFANINHEIRTPLTLILLAADGIARSGEGLGAGTVEHLEQVKASTRRLLYLVNSLLMLAAGDEGKLRIRPGPADAGACLLRLTQAWRSAADSGQLELEYRGPDECAATIDEATLETVVGNLVSNAVKFTPPGGRIAVTLEPTAHTLTITVRDTGPGIEPEFLPQLFGRFERSLGARSRGVRGTGIGLSLSKELVDLQHGSISVVNHDDPSGTSFVVRIPRYQEASPVLPSEERAVVLASIEPTPRVLTPPAPKQRSRAPEATILLAEDDPGLSAHIAELLSERYHVLCAANGRIALDMARQHLPDLLVTDLDMPEMNGVDLTREFLALQGTALSPVLIVSAYAGLGERLAGFEAGAVDYIVKPFSADEFLARVRSQLAIRRLAYRLHESQKMATVGILSAGLAHELRNPANAVVNAVPLLLGMLPPEQRLPDSSAGVLAQVVIEGANQIRERCKNILDYSRAERVVKREENLQQLLARVQRTLSATLAGIEVREDVQLEGTVECAGPLVEQILANLVDNAAYAAGAGGWIQITVRREGALAVIEVADSGPGVPVHLQERIFDPFFTTKPVGQGSGLGLTISRRIALNHGGELRIVRRGESTVFRLELPA